MKKGTISKILLIIAIVLVVACIGVVGYGVIKKLTTTNQYPIATIDIKDYGVIKLELYPDMAPNTVTNFIALANKGYYNNLTFHRVISDFMIQGGDKKGDGTGTVTLGDLRGTDDTKEYAIKGEMIANGFSKNTLKLERGVIAMARSQYSYDSAGSQFFIIQKDNNNINGSYAGFGKVIEGMDIVDQIANLEVTYKSEDLKDGEEAPKDAEGNELTADMPKNKPVINSITVDTYGEDYGEPETTDPFNYYDYLMKQYNSYQGE